MIFGNKPLFQTIHEGKTSTGGAGVAQETVVNSVEQKISAPLAYVEGLDDLPIRVFRLPLGPTESHIQGMLNRGLLKATNIYVGPGRWQEFCENAKTSQVMGRQIENYDELERIITDPDIKKSIRESMETGGAYPVIYVMNHEARLAWASYLGGRLPNSPQEQMKVWNALPGDNVLAKATHAGTPFSGYFFVGERKFYNVGDGACLVSSAPFESEYNSLLLVRDIRDASDFLCRPRHGYSALVVQDKA